MAGPQKRALPAKVVAMKDRKRRKLDGAGGVEKKQKLASATPKNVRLDDLAWKEVEMPDRLEDLEGFFGLEEIDHVDVVKDDGKVSYRATGDRLKGTNPEKDDDEQDDVADTEEWSGFDEEEENQEKEVASTAFGQIEHVAPLPAKEPGDEGYVEMTKAERKQKQKQEQKKKQKKEAKAKKEPKEPKESKNSQADPGLSFSAIGDLLDGDDKEGADITEWRPLNLNEDTLSALSKMQFAKPTLIQKTAIPEILAGHDVIGKASTGSGKTLAFGIPVIERFLELQAMRKNAKRPATDEEKARTPALALILSPTRELAHQITAHLNGLCSGLEGRGPSIACLTGGLSILKQQRQLKTADVVIGTPGRLWEIISSGHGILKWLKQINFLIVDEADRLLSQGHFKEVEEIINVLDRKDNVAGADDDDEGPEIADEEIRQRQTLVFSATFHKGLQQKLAGKQKPGSGGLMDQKDAMQYLIKKLNFREDKPKFVDVNPVSQMASNLKEGLVECGGTEKVASLT